MPSTHDRLFAAAAVMAGLHGAVAVALGAYAAHAMGATHGDGAVAWVQTASTYQLIHAAALAGAGAAAMRIGGGWGRRALALAVGLIAVGAVLFCGTLYGLALAGLHGLGSLAPVGGVMMIAGWLALATAGLASFGRAGGARGVERAGPAG